MKSLWRMSRRRPARRITQKNNSIGGVCRLTYCNTKQIGGILIAKLIVAEKPSVAMSYAKVLGATSRQDGYLEGNGYLVSWCVGHLVELAPPNVYDAKYVKWSIADLPILPQKWQYLVSTSTKKQFGILQKLMHRPDVDSIVNSCDSGREGELIFRLVYQQAECKKPFSRLWLSSMEETLSGKGSPTSNRQLNTMRCTTQHFAGNVPTGWSASMRPGFFRACTANRWRWGVL